MPRKKQKTVTVGFVALGCPKNVVDSERMLAQIAEAGFWIAAEPERADVVIINTCGFIEPAEIESLAAVEQAVAKQKEGPREEGHCGGLPVAAPVAQLLECAAGIDAVVGLEHATRLSRSFGIPWRPGNAGFSWSHVRGDDG